jgi:hypothetical protein
MPKFILNKVVMYCYRLSGGVVLFNSTDYCDVGCIDEWVYEKI